MRTAATQRRTDRLRNDDYLRLVTEFPLVPIRSHEQAERACVRLSRLIGRADQHLSQGESDYAEALACLVESFEQKHVRFRASKMTPVQALKYLMEQSEMTTSQLGQIIGTHSAASMILNGRRQISKSIANKLARRFRVSAALFI